jgi:hypothetical protein
MNDSFNFSPQCPIAEIIHDETGLTHEQIQEVATRPGLTFAERFSAFNLDSLDVIEMVMIFEGFTSAVSSTKTESGEVVIDEVVPIDACEYCAQKNDCSLLGLFISTLDEDV